MNLGKKSRGKKSSRSRASSKKAMSLVLASVMMSSMFAAAVNAVGYELGGGANVTFTKVVDSKVDSAEEVDLTNIVMQPGQVLDLVIKTDSISTAAYDTTSSSSGKSVSPSDVTKLLADGKKIKDELEAAATKTWSTDATVCKAMAKPIQNAVEWIARVKGDVVGTSSLQEVQSTVKDVAISFSKVIKKIKGSVEITKITKAEDVHSRVYAAEDKASATPAAQIGQTATGGSAFAGNEDVIINRAAMWLNTTANHFGIRIADDADSYGSNKYKIVGWTNAKVVGASTNADAVALDFNGVTVASGNIDLTGNVHDNAALLTKAGTKLTKTVALTAAADVAIVQDKAYSAAGHISTAANGTVVKQLAEAVNLCDGWFYDRAYDVLKGGEDQLADSKTKNEYKMSYLGAGSQKSGFNGTEDYTVTFNATGGGKSAATVKRAIQNELDGKISVNGKPLGNPVVVRITANPSLTKDETVTGKLTITSNAKQNKKIEISSVSITVSKGEPIEDADKINGQSLTSGTKVKSGALKEAARSTDQFEYKLNVGAVTDALKVEVANGKGNLKTNSVTLNASVSSDEDLESKYAKETKNEKDKNEVAILDFTNLSHNKSKMTISLDTDWLVDAKVNGADKFAGLENGQKVYLYLVDKDRDELKKSEAKASAKDGVVDDQNRIEGKVIDGRLEFTIDPAKVSLDDDKQFLLSKNSLDIKDVKKEKEAEEDKDDDKKDKDKDDEDEDEDDVEDKKDNKDNKDEKIEDEIADLTESEEKAAANDVNAQLPVVGGATDVVGGGLVDQNNQAEQSNRQGVPNTGANGLVDVAVAMALVSLAAGTIAMNDKKK